MDYKIAIPSFNRPIQLAKKTLKFLQNNNIPNDKIYIFVHSESQYNYYRIYVPDDMHLIITNQNGLISTRNFIVDYFDIDSYIISMDDDVTNIKRLHIHPDGKKTLMDLNNLEQTFQFIYQLLDKTQTYLFGTYGRNPLFMSTSVDTRFSFIDGAFYGFINRKLDSLKITHVQFGDDTELALKYHKHDGKTLNIKFLAVLHSIANNDGGLQDRYNSRIEQQKIDSEKLVELFPDYLSGIREDKKTKFWLPVKLNKKRTNVEIIEQLNIIN
jgi:hypothetical protein